MHSGGAVVQWKVRSEQPLYKDEWLDIRIADVELPDGRHLDHRLIRTPPGAGMVAVDAAGRVLAGSRRRVSDSPTCPRSRRPGCAICRRRGLGRLDRAGTGLAVSALCRQD